MKMPTLNASAATGPMFLTVLGAATDLPVSVVEGAATDAMIRSGRNFRMVTVEAFVAPSASVSVGSGLAGALSATVSARLVLRLARVGLVRVTTKGFAISPDRNVIVWLFCR